MIGYHAFVCLSAIAERGSFCFMSYQASRLFPTYRLRSKEPSAVFVALFLLF